MTIRLSQDEFASLVEQALTALPEQFEAFMENVSVDIDLRPTAEFMRLHHLGGSRRNLLGLYVGRPLTEKSVSAPWEWPEQIFIFQRNIEDICDTRQEIVHQVRQTVLHEIGHHFGMDEDDLEQYGYG